MTILKEIIPASVSILFIFVAFLHSRELDLSNPSAYTGSLYLPLEMSLAVITVGMFFWSGYRALLALYKKEWKKFFLRSAATVVIFIFFAIALQVDAPTLIYMT